MEEMFTEDELNFVKYQERKLQTIIKMVGPVGDETYKRLKKHMGNEYLNSVLALCNEVLAFCLAFLMSGDDDEDENE